VTLANAAFSRMFYLDRNEYLSPAALVKRPLRDVIPADVTGGSGTAAAARRSHGHHGG